MSAASDIAKFLKSYGDLILEKTEMNFPAQIISYNASAFTATIRPMLFTNNEAGMAQVVDVPDLPDIPVERPGGVKPFYRAGDLVSVRCYASNLSQPMKGTKANMRDSRFQLNSCSVSGALKLKTAETNFIWFDESSVNVSGVFKVSEDIVLNGRSLADFLAAYDLHTHSVPGVTAGPATVATTPPV